MWKEILENKATTQTNESKNKEQPLKIPYLLEFSDKSCARAHSIRVPGVLFKLFYDPVVCPLLPSHRRSGHKHSAI